MPEGRDWWLSPLLPLPRSRAFGSVLQAFLLALDPEFSTSVLLRAVKNNVGLDFRKSGLSVPLEFLDLEQAVLIYPNFSAFTCKMGFMVPPVTELFVRS